MSYVKLKKELEKRYLDFKARDLKLDMSRGKPASEHQIYHSVY